MKNIFFATAFLAFVMPASAQKFFTRDARVQFNATSSMEKIEAVNKSGSILINTETGEIAAKTLVKNFIFEKALMQEHFNENYMESSKFPNASFSGKITDLSKVNFKSNGTYNTTVRGTFDMHGVKKEIEVPAKITVNGSNISVNADFNVACADYNIAIPSVVADKIAKEVKINISGTLAPKQ